MLQHLKSKKKPANMVGILRNNVAAIAKIGDEYYCILNYIPNNEENIYSYSAEYKFQNPLEALRVYQDFYISNMDKQFIELINKNN